MQAITENWKRAYLEHVTEAGVAPEPNIMILLLNTKCNLRCEFCHLWEESKEMKTEDCIKILNEGVLLGVKNLVLTGGEPFLHKDLFRIVKEAKKMGYGINITTNGTMIEARIGEIAESSVDSISVSIDGLAETHDLLRQSKGCFSKAMKGISLLIKELGKERVSIYFVVTNKNVRELKKIYNLSLELGVKFDFWPVNNAQELYLKDEPEINAYNEFLDYIDQKDPEFNEKKEYYKNALAYHKEADTSVRCLGLCNQFGITADGDLRPCCVWMDPDFKVGNVINGSLVELWNSDRAREIRKKIFATGCPNKCYNHALYEFSQVTKLSFTVKK